LIYLKSTNRRKIGISNDAESLSKSEIGAEMAETLLLRIEHGVAT
jgi:hypothetical protein